MQRYHESWADRQRLVALLAQALATLSSKSPDLPGVLATEPAPPRLEAPTPENAGPALDNAALEFKLLMGEEWPFFRDASRDGPEQDEPDTQSPYDDW